MVATKRIPIIHTTAALDYVLLHCSSAPSKHPDDALEASLVCVAFVSPYCTACQQMEPFLPILRTMFPAIRFYRVEFDAARELRALCSVTTTPTFVLFRAGKLAGAHVGPDEHGLRVLLVEHGARGQARTMPQQQRWQRYQEQRWGSGKVPAPANASELPLPPLPPTSKRLKYGGFALPGDNPPPGGADWSASEMVDLRSVDPTIPIRIPQRLANRLTEAAGKPRCLLQLPCAKALSAVQAHLLMSGLSLQVLGGYRPWTALRDASTGASQTCASWRRPDPYEASACALSRGTAVELTLQHCAVSFVDSEREAAPMNLPMPAPFVGLSAGAFGAQTTHRTALGTVHTMESGPARRHLEALHEALLAHGFVLRDPVAWWEVQLPEASAHFPIYDELPAILLPLGPHTMVEAASEKVAAARKWRASVSLAATSPGGDGDGKAVAGGVDTSTSRMRRRTTFASNDLKFGEHAPTSAGVGGHETRRRWSLIRRTHGESLSDIEAAAWRVVLGPKDASEVRVHVETGAKAVLTLQSYEYQPELPMPQRERRNFLRENVSGRSTWTFLSSKSFGNLGLSRRPSSRSRRPSRSSSPALMSARSLAIDHGDHDHDDAISEAGNTEMSGTAGVRSRAILGHLAILAQVATTPFVLLKRRVAAQARHSPDTGGLARGKAGSQRSQSWRAAPSLKAAASRRERWVELPEHQHANEQV